MIPLPHEIKSVYLAGKMSGLQDWNFPAFHAATRDLRGRGLVVMSPAEHDEEGGFDCTVEQHFSPERRAESMKWDEAQIHVVDAVVVLPGWEAGRGSRAEVALAQYLDKPILLYPTLERYTTPPESVLQEAHRIIHGARRKDYGPAEEGFIKMATGWSVIFGHEVTSTQVALAMTWLKVCRFLNSHDRDSLVDLAGYAGLAAQIEGID